MKLLKQFVHQLSLGSKVIKLVWDSSPLYTSAYLFFLIGQALISTAMVYAGKLVVDALVAASTNRTEQTFYYFLTMIVLVATLRTINNLSVSLRRFFSDTLKDKFGLYATYLVASHMASLDLAYFEDPSFQDKLEKIRREVDSRPFDSLTYVANIIAHFVGITSLIATTVVVQWWIPIVITLVFLPRLIFSFKLSYKTYRITDKRSPYYREIRILTNLLIGRQSAAEIKVFELKDYLLERFRSIYSRFIVENKDLAWKNNTVSFLLNFANVIISSLILIRVAIMTIASQATIGTFTFMTNALVQMGTSYVELFEAIAKFYENSLFLEDYFEFIGMNPKIVDLPNAKNLNLAKPLRIEFRNVSFGYNPSKLVLKNISFKVSEGENIAIIGENGAGKTTLIKLLLRVYDVTSGEILLNGINIKDIKLTSLRAAVSVIFQDFSRYDMTVRENIGFGNVTNINNIGAIQKAARLSGAVEFIEEFPDKYKTMLGTAFDKGTDLSGGQWQKIAIARAFFRNARAIIMDEPTSALDPKSEYEVFKNLIEHTKDKSLILISHRFSTVRLADEIIVLHKGQIIESGTHEELTKKNGQYAKLYKLQAKWYK